MKFKSNFRIAKLTLPLLSSCLTGCVTISKELWFGGQSTIEMKDGTDVALWLDPTDREKEFPLWLNYYATEPPYTLSIFFPKSNPAWQAATIDRVTVQYADGTVHERKGSGIVWRRGKSGEMSLYRGPLKDLVTRHMSCNITVKGTILSKGGKKTGFSFSHQFDAEPGNTQIVPTLWAMDQAG